MTTIFTAENQAGDIIIIHAAPGFTQDSFTTYVLSFMRDLDGDDPNAQHLDLYAWDDHETFSRWLQGSECVPFVSWSRMAENACYGRLEYVYPGRLMFLRPNEKPPAPSSAWMDENRPLGVPGDENAYPADDPKNPGWHSTRADLYDNREGK